MFYDLCRYVEAVDADAAKGEQPVNRQEDHIRGAIIALYGHCADTGIAKSEDARRELALKRIIKARGGGGGGDVHVSRVHSRVFPRVTCSCMLLPTCHVFMHAYVHVSCVHSRVCPRVTCSCTRLRACLFPALFLDV